MSTAKSILFEPLRLGALTVSGRLFKTATSETRASDDGFVTDELLEFYEPMARAGTPLLITGNLYVDRQGKSTPRMGGIDDDDKVPGLARLTSLVHERGSKIFAQVNHCGRQVVPRSVALDEAVSASGVKELFLGTKPRPLTAPEIATAVRRFAEAAERARKAGFDGVQIHAAHGYLINQFLTPYTNRRDDGYGGSFANRLRFLSEVFRATRKRVGDDFPVILKLNGSDALPLRPGLGTARLVEVARAMEEQGIDAVEVSVGHYESGLPVVRGKFWRYFRGVLRDGTARDLPRARYAALAVSWPVAAILFNLLWRYRPGFNLRYARRFKEALTVPVIAVGGFLTREQMEKPLRDGLCDAVSSGRAMIADPFLYRHVAEGTEGPRCVFCNACVARVGGMPVDCYHPRVRREKDALLARAIPVDSR
jgi:2,4-dienoyl-CoA reductase-like NADH-dependent reductase (Old Yellow Enzyme family)